MRLIRLPEVTHMTGLGKTAIYNYIKLGEFPRPVKLGRTSCWVESEIVEWIAELVRRRDATPSNGG
ncbi:helix-turn-helix transcriptional regulator [Ralstonia pseudosolanacearum]|uniref:helix-turn-helix transcriptional regulator n=1 Tax=Ralstonia pseudosolanacearum TaxID=1310165 RepID=UPI000B92E1DE|nr:AlpA family transcriptional regulator [Ralstonia pseudosolanacearum]